MSHYASLVRDGAGLEYGLAGHRRIGEELDALASGARGTRRLAEAKALHRVAKAILASALARTESRGAHFRSDYPQRNDREFEKHSVLGPDGVVRFESW
jgi:succinate dehydrogenase/fumarate reductase flavoprotein subunit